MNVSDMMTWDPVTIPQNASLSEAVVKMESIGCHHLPVISANGHVVGVITSQDCRASLETLPVSGSKRPRQQDLQEITVRDVMTPAPIIAEPDMTVGEAARLLLVNHIGCLPVMRGETLVGIITTSDILMAFIKLTKY